MNGNAMLDYSHARASRRCSECDGLVVDGECVDTCGEDSCAVDGCDGTIASRNAADADESGDLVANACRVCGQRDGDCALCGRQICECSTTNVVECDVSPECADRFDVTLKNERSFRGCGIQGSGGALRGRESFIRAQGIRVHRVMMRIITKDRADGSRFVDVRCIDIATIAKVHS